jgi:hypothetical protein
MKTIGETDILEFLKNNIEPIDDYSYGIGFRASVYLVDGTFLPCVIFRSSKKIVELAIKRFNDEQSGKSIFSKPSKSGYYEIVKTFVTKGNCINAYDICKVEKSKYAFPISVLKQIKGETTMGWTGFVVKMNDGKCFSFGTTFLMEFFQMPEDYSVGDIEEIINHSYISTAGKVCSHKVPFFEYPSNYNNSVVYRERPFFECYLDSL